MAEIVSHVAFESKCTECGIEGEGKEQAWAAYCANPSSGVDEVLSHFIEPIDVTPCGRQGLSLGAELPSGSCADFEQCVPNFMLEDSHTLENTGSRNLDVACYCALSAFHYIFSSCGSAQHGTACKSLPALHHGRALETWSTRSPGSLTCSSTCRAPSVKARLIRTVPWFLKRTGSAPPSQTASRQGSPGEHRIAVSEEHQDCGPLTPLPVSTSARLTPSPDRLKTPPLMPAHLAKQAGDPVRESSKLIVTELSSPAYDGACGVACEGSGRHREHGSRWKPGPRSASSPPVAQAGERASQPRQRAAERQHGLHRTCLRSSVQSDAERENTPPSTQSAFLIQPPKAHLLQRAPESYTPSAVPGRARGTGKVIEQACSRARPGAAVESKTAGALAASNHQTASPVAAPASVQGDSVAAKVTAPASVSGDSAAVEATASETAAWVVKLTPLQPGSGEGSPEPQAPAPPAASAASDEQRSSAVGPHSRSCMPHAGASSVAAVQEPEAHTVHCNPPPDLVASSWVAAKSDTCLTPVSDETPGVVREETPACLGGDRLKSASPGVSRASEDSAPASLSPATQDLLNVLQGVRERSRAGVPSLSLHSCQPAPLRCYISLEVPHASFEQAL